MKSFFFRIRNIFEICVKKTACFVAPIEAASFFDEERGEKDRAESGYRFSIEAKILLLLKKKAILMNEMSSCDY